MKNLNCKRDLTSEEIINNFGSSSEDIELCNNSKCENLVYSNGMLTCSMLLKHFRDIEMKGE